MIRLDVGAGPSSDCEYQIDVFKWPKTTHVLDAQIEKWPFEDEFFEEVRMESFLEHCPPSVRISQGMKVITVRPRVHVMREAYRVLRPGRNLIISFPEEQAEHSQDPTHEGPMITEGTINYFCGQWGGNEPGSFTREGYGIDFAFIKVDSYRTGPIRTMVLRKP